MDRKHRKNKQMLSCIEFLSNIHFMTIHWYSHNIWIFPILILWIFNVQLINAFVYLKKWNHVLYAVDLLYRNKSFLLAIFLKRSYSYHFGFSQLDYISFSSLVLKDYFYLKYKDLINLASLMKYLMQVYY